jgi:DNA adenine methylase
MAYTCEHCGDIVKNLDDYDHNDDGWWCDCNNYGDLGYFNFFDKSKKPQLKIYLESDHDGIPIKSLPKNKKVKSQISPFRYPGGKSKLAKYIATQIRPTYQNTLISPFCGGASVELALLESNIVNNLVLNDLDPLIYNVFNMILKHPTELINELKSINIDHQLFNHAKKIVLGKEIENNSITKAALTLINNRCSYSGIYYAGALGGKNGDVKTLTSRLNIQNLCEKIITINKLQNHITLLNLDVHAILNEYTGNHNTLYIDPPYVKNGPKLYAKNYGTLNEHYNLLLDVQSNFEEFPSDDILLFYDDDEFIDRYCINQPIKLRRKFSINKKSNP